MDKVKCPYCGEEYYDYELAIHTPYCATEHDGIRIDSLPPVRITNEITHHQHYGTNRTMEVGMG